MMIRIAIAAYQRGDVSQGDLFVVLAKRILEDEWDAAFATLNSAMQQAFIQWGKPLVGREQMRLFAAEVGEVLSRKQTETLRSEFEKRGWCGSPGRLDNRNDG